ncbi:hypothetical protein BO94DRAFT_594515 [Aspergillus sclerotioniger CBS 115572]|uniref:Uncharacterized protein n=1 Tax=Aspergillus sclerotioniger CBS 115572 TaxID=1450535 RepID=A0A317WTK3_9EURO|nr:hypothetical protein BO94DRAFT_594515 [Aspergillus sclerotioniger CBS 115572]PWY89659.1 hypothetical protein BO94DRAFT_594515 [Aspergillus sclerotioniger CBS 115572]
MSSTEPNQQDIRLKDWLCHHYKALSLIDQIRNDEVENIQSEWRNDKGYGTHLTTFLRKTAPHAAVYVAKVFDHRENLNSYQDQIASAIRYAVDVWKVDIIIMPWWFNKNPGKPIYPAIEHAAFHDIMLEWLLRRFNRVE